MEKVGGEGVIRFFGTTNQVQGETKFKKSVCSSGKLLVHLTSLKL